MKRQTRKNTKQKSMNKFADYFFNKEKKLLIDKWHHYFEIYDRHFSKFIGKHPVILEIGVYKGGSLEMYNHYFDGKCKIYGVDINKECLDIPSKLGVKNIEITIGDQESREFWKEFLKGKPKFDIVIEDGGHMPKQQIITYEEVYDHVSDNGVYLCEDTHTSYWEDFSGGIGKPHTFIEYSKSFIDMLNFYHIRSNPVGNKDVFEKFRKTTKSVHYYDSVVVLEKRLDNDIPIATQKPGKII